MEYRTNGRTAAVFIAGELDHHTLRDISRELRRIIDTLLPKKLVIDMKDVSFMDSSGIALIIGAVKHMQELEGTVTLRDVPPAPMKIFMMAGINRYIDTEEGGKAI